MKFKTVVIRWIWAGIGLFLVAFGYAGISQNADSIAKWIAPRYVGLNEEEIFKRSNIPCVRPAGAKAGCSYPDAEAPEPSGDKWRDRANAKLSELKHAREVIAIQTPEYLHYNEYFEREIVPRRDRLTLWTGILFSLVAIGIVLYSLGSARTWWKTSAASDMARVRHKLFQSSWISKVQDDVASRKLRRLDSDFQALRSLHQNGLISDEQFEQRKQALRASIDIN